MDYREAMHVKTQAEADAWLAAAVSYYCSLPLGKICFRNAEPVLLPSEVVEPNPKETIVRLKQGLAYYAGYFSDETRERVERLFQCEHPIFGKFAVHGRPQDPIKIALEQGVSGMLGRREERENE